jgi:hypothetical protein
LNRLIAVIIVIILSVLSGCAHRAELNKQEKFLAAAPRSILIVPVVNNSVDITAADYLLSTITIPLAERGYYVFPVNMVKRLLEDDGLADSSLVHSAPASKLANLFGADAVLYITVQQWDAQYMVLSTRVTVALDYQIRDGRTDESLWSNKEKIVYMPDDGGGGGLGGLIAKAIVAAITKGLPNYMPLARQANDKALLTYPGKGIPLGPYATEQKELSPGSRK